MAYHLTIISKPGGETESIEFSTPAAAINHWADRAYELTRKGWFYDSKKDDEMLSRFIKGNQSITVYLGKS